MWPPFRRKQRGGGFDGLKVLLHSLRAVDKQRDFLLMAIEGGQPGALSPPDGEALAALAAAFVRTRVMTVPHQAHFKQLNA